MDPASQLPTSDWIQWALGGWAAFSAGIIAHLYARIEEVKDMAQDKDQNGLREVWEAIDGLRKDMAEDRRDRSREQLALAEKVITRDEFHHGIQQIITLVKNGKEH